MAYEYDVFLSYNRKFPHGEWVHDVFFPLFEPYLADALNQRKVKIFKDTAEIKTGMAWKNRIRTGLIQSKVMVSIFSPAYFQSEWCMREFATFLHRQTKLGFGSDAQPMGLVIPIRLFDGEHFPEYASNLQMLDCIKHNRVGAGVRHTNLYFELQGMLQDWVADVATAIKIAPEWNPDWLEESWVEEPFEKLKGPQKPSNMKPPVL